MEFGLGFSRGFRMANDVDCRRTPRRREAFRYCAEIGHLLVVQQCTELGTCRDKRHASTNGSKSNGEGEVGAGLEVVAALREELLPGDALLVAHSPRA